MFLTFPLWQVSGLGILIAGILVLIDVNEYDHFLEGKIQAPPIILIVTGALIFFIAFIGLVCNFTNYVSFHAKH